MKNTIINIYVHGTRYKIGYKIGAIHQKYIKYKAEKAYDELNSEQRRWVLASWQITKKYCPDFVAELTGISEGAKTSPIKVFTKFCEEIDDFSNGCTDIIAMPNATKNHETLIGHNNDELPDDAKPMIIRSTTPDGVTAVGISYNGFGYGVGFNNLGISITGNHLSQNDIKEGIPRLVLLQEMMRAHTFEDVVKLASHPERASSYNNVIATPQQLVSLEGSARRLTPIIVKSGIFAHANHYLSQKLKDKVENKNKKDMAGSIARINRAAVLLQESKGKHTIDTFKKILSDHGSKIRDICNHTGKPNDSLRYCWIRS